jgi:hypothetical protein
MNDLVFWKVVDWSKSLTKLMNISLTTVNLKLNVC